MGSSCHLRGAQSVVELLQRAVEEKNLADRIVLMGGFCAGKCNPCGATVTVNDDVYAGINKENFDEFWNERIQPLLDKE